MGVIEYLFLTPGVPGSVFARWANILFGAHLGIAAALLILAGVMLTLNARHGLHLWITRRILWWGLGLQVLGVAMLGLRLVNWPVLSMRVWLYLALIGQAVAASYLLWWMRQRYPDRLAVYEWEEKKRAFLPRAAGGEIEPRRRKATGRRRR